MTAKVAPAAQAALYCRLSKEDKDSKRAKKADVDSIAVQTADATRAIHEMGWAFDPERHTFVDDDVSGRMVKRDGWSDMIAAASRGEFSILVARDLDRVARYEPARQMATLIDLFDRGVRVWTYKDRSFVKLSGPESIVTYARAIASEQYVESIRTNAINAINARALGGQAIKQPGLGYTIEDHGDKGKRWVIVPEQAEKVLYISKLFIGCKSVTTVAKRLNEEALATPWGAKWRANSVTALLRRPLYRGYYQHGDQVIPHPELRIWTPEMEAQIDALLARPMKPWSNTPRHLSTPFLRCGKCGGVMAAARPGRSRAWYLVCDHARRSACEGLGFRKEAVVDAALLSAVGSLIDDTVWNRVKEIMRDALEEHRQADTREAELERLGREVQGAARKVRNLTESVAEADSKEERTPILAKLREETKRLETLRVALKSAEAAPTPKEPESVVEAAERRVEELRATLARGGIEARPALGAILGEEKFRVDRKGKEWVLTCAHRDT